MIRHWLVLLLVLALPLQGALAASRMCAAMHTSAPAAADAGHAAHAAVHHAHQRGEHSGHHHAEHGNVNDDGAGSCSLCAGCCLTVAVGSAVPFFTPTDASYAAPPPVVATVMRNIADGLERPPRTI